MRKVLLTGALMLASFLGKSQFTQSDLIYYVGEGPDTAVCVVDFLDSTPDSCFAWGFLFDATTTVTGGDMLAAISADEDRLNVVTGGGFLNEIHYNAHTGVGGAPNWWGTWSKTAETAWVLNGGLGEELANGDWFGCTYTDFDPAVAPGEPIPAYESAKYTTADVQFWVGTGADSAVLVLDFVTPTYGEAVTYAWGYLFDGSTDGATMLADIDAADVNLDIDAGAFLNDIIFNDLEGLAGEPNWWGTWSGTNLTDWTMNAGLSAEINPGDWFGCSYADWPPRRPFYPISALDSAAFTAADVEFTIGAGDNFAVMVLDFNEWYAGESFAFGYNFEGETVTAEQILTDLAATPELVLTADMTGGFLNDIVYGAAGLSGIGGDPYYWGTWSATNVGGWVMNTGIGEELTDGDWFACTYTSWGPATPPSLPANAETTIGVIEEALSDISVYPNPANGIVNIQLASASTILLVDLQGRTVAQMNGNKGVNVVDVATFAPGIYFVLAEQNGQLSKQKLVIK